MTCNQLIAWRRGHLSQGETNKWAENTNKCHLRKARNEKVSSSRRSLTDSTSQSINAVYLICNWTTWPWNCSDGTQSRNGYQQITLTEVNLRELHDRTSRRCNESLGGWVLKDDVSSVSMWERNESFLKLKNIHSGWVKRTLFEEAICKNECLMEWS